MGICPNCGSWVDEGDICGCCGGSGSYSYENNDDEEDGSEDIIDSRFIKRDEYSKKAWDYYMDFKEADALHYINLALDLDKSHSNNWNIKAIILEAMERYEESEECYDKSLKLFKRPLVSDNKARMLRAWAGHLLEESKKLPNGLTKLEEALEKNRKAINSLPGDDSKENFDDYLRQKDSINFYINYEKEYQNNLGILKTYPKDELFTIAGRHFYRNNINLTPGLPLKLVKEPDNEHDKDAIAVYAKDEKIGYVANNLYTKFELTSSASELQDKIQNTVEGIYLLYLERYADIQFPIGRIIK